MAHVQRTGTEVSLACLTCTAPFARNCLSQHTKGKMPLKDLINYFKPYFAGEPEAKKDFFSIVKRIAKVCTEGDEKFAKLSQPTLVQYRLLATD